MTPSTAKVRLFMEEVITLTVVKALSLKHRVEKCVYSRDGKRMAACLGDFSLKVYEIEDCACDYQSSAHAVTPGSPAHPPSYTLQNLCTLKGHTSNVWSINFSQDALLLCSGSSDKTVRVWRLAKQETFFTFIHHSDTVWCCSFVPCHPHLVVSGSSDKTVKIWNYSTGDIVHDLQYSDAVETLSFSKDGTKLCTGSRDGKIVLWSDMFSEIDTVPVQSVLYETDEWIRFVCFSDSDNNLLITTGSSNAVLVWDLNGVTFTGTVASLVDSDNVATPVEHLDSDNVASPVEHLDSGNVASPVEHLDSGNVASLVECSDSDNVASPVEHSGSDNVASPVEHLGSDNVASPVECSDSESSISKTVLFAETTDTCTPMDDMYVFKPKVELQGHLNTVWDSCFAVINYSHSESNRNLVISCSGDRSLRFWDLSNGVCVQETHLEGQADSQILTCSYTSTTQLLAIGTYGGNLLVIKLK